MSSSFTLFHKPTLPVSKSFFLSTLPCREKKALRCLSLMTLSTDSIITTVFHPLSLILHHCTSNSLVQSWLEWSTAFFFSLLQCWRETAVLCSTWKYECEKYALQLFGWQHAPPYDPVCREWPETMKMGCSLPLCHEQLYCIYIWPQRYREWL